ncbi:ATP-dependent DNA helicase [Trichonephila clavipes]|uniref:ATP-dependent DNA helicase n=1 Tax=Trichonephila clavipes TaxID=2585209 RepID=A0A8X7BAP5_TRICX|nr:ATP-dependent DNA helicase [Trichonephila clavipes]
MHEDLGKTKVYAKFVRHTLTPEQKAMRSARNIISAAENDPNFYNSIVTGDSETNSFVSMQQVCLKFEQKFIFCELVTSNMDILLRCIREIDIGQSSIGDICAAHYVLDDGTNIIMVVVYISPNYTVNNIIKFLYKRLMIYGQVGSEELKENYHMLILILEGYFSVNFTFEDGQLYVNFLQDKLELQMNKVNNNRNETTTGHGTIDADLSRYLSNFRSKTYVSNFSYYKPIVSVLQSTTVITNVSDNESNE